MRKLYLNMKQATTFNNFKKEIKGLNLVNIFAV